MATAPQPQLPLFYNDLMPLNSRDHATWKSRSMDSAEWLKGQHAIPLTVDEFVQSQRDFPIVFSSGDNPLPLALMGLNEGVNTFVDDKGKINEPVYLPAYVRRYPFMLAKLTQDGEDLSLCFDPTSGSVGEFDEGNALFDGEGKASEATQNILQFCEHFESAGQRTKVFIDELKKHELLMDGEISISQQENPEKPFVYRGFQMINQEKLQDVRGDVLREWNKNGMIALIYAHIMSLDLMRTIFARQVSQGTAPTPSEPAA
ncbi:SapC family protein [Pontixanthobacter gangjinensis]|uniref:Multidrug transporter n=1 Tax=Pontixanthobacter gangjinensis TaxID=1028742 RepID=A0A6I4SM25_9SPHN|nr:SapC family protein [Pontixanthobacter gangjinensis]MXO56724.1 multidrug transporter [Pontixanthobacter gangjinensis]